MQQPNDFEFESKASESTFGPGKLLEILWRSKWFVLLCVVIAMFLGAVYYVRQAPVYESSASLLIINKNRQVFAPNDLKLGQNYLEDYLSTQLLILKSGVIADEALKGGKLDQLKSLSGNGDPKSIIMKSLSVTREAEGSSGVPNVLKLSYRGPVAEECALILATIVESYDEFLKETYKNENEEFIGLMKSAKNTLNDGVTTKKDKLESLVMENPFLAELTESGKTQTEVDRENWSKQLSEIQMEYEVLKDSLATGIVLPKYKQQSTTNNSKQVKDEFLKELDRLEIEDAKLSLQNFGPDYPDRQVLLERIKLFREKISALSDQSHPANKKFIKEFAQERMNERYLELQVTIGILKSQIKQAREDLAPNRSVLQEYKTLHKEIDNHQRLYDKILNRLESVKVGKNLGGYDSKVLSAPQIGIQVAPRPLNIFLLALLGGLLVGFGVARLLELLDRSFRSPEEIRQRLGLPIIGHIPKLVVKKETLEQLEANHSPLDPHLTAEHRPKSMEAEAFRGVRTSLYFSTRGRDHKILQVTSPNMSDGKSTLLANLAVSMAQSGKRVLIIDADFRRPRQHKLFGLSNDKGVVSVLNDGHELAKVVSETAVPNLSILPCGPRPANPAELLTSSAFHEFLEVAKEQYDLVLVDTPPVLVVSDPAIVAPRVDGVLLIVRIVKNGRPDAERAKEILNSLDVNTLGVIVNGVGLNKAYGYGRYENSRSQYGYKSDYYREKKSSYYEEPEHEDTNQLALPLAHLNGKPITPNGKHP